VDELQVKHTWSGERRDGVVKKEMEWVMIKEMEWWEKKEMEWVVRKEMEWWEKRWSGKKEK
jgi:hypothetical protein